MNKEENLYLREDVYFEPLIHKWYCWPYLIPPLTAALNFTTRNLRLMKSFIENPELHLSASNSSTFVGGSFMNCEISEKDNITNIINDLESNYSDYFKVKEAIIELNAILEDQNGMSIEHLYENVPSILKGYVELVYDMNHNASFRPIEGLIYKGELYKRSAQSVSFGLPAPMKERPFVLSSPRFADGEHIHYGVEFADPWIDRVLELRSEPKPLSYISDLMESKEIEGRLPYLSLFTNIPPRKIFQPLVSSDQVRVSYLGHAGLMLETSDVVILVDPVIACLDGMNDDKIITFNEIPKVIDYVCITHTHMDHLSIETLLQLRSRIRQVLVPKSGGGLADPSLKLMLRQLNFNVLEVEEMEELQFSFGKIVAIPFLGEHAGLNIRAKTAWFFELNGKTVLAAADSSSLDPDMYYRINKIINNVDLLFIGMECVGAPMSWLYGALFTKPIPRAINESRRFNGSNFTSARKIIEIFNPKEVGIYALGIESWYRYFMGVSYTNRAPQMTESDLLIEYCQKSNILIDRLHSRKTYVL